MSQSGTNQIHKIQEFPKYFSRHKTCYNETDFSGTVRSACCALFSANDTFKTCKLIIVGDINVGKTSIVNRFTRQLFTFNYKATIGVDFQTAQFEILKVPFNIQIWDTAGQERFKCIASAYYRKAHVIVAVFDLTNLKSLHNSLVWLQEALKENSSTSLKFLVGTKQDLMKNSADAEVGSEASKLADCIGAEYWEVSSKTGKNIKELFYRMAALSFERIICVESELSEVSRKIQLGQNLTDCALCIGELHPGRFLSGGADSDPSFL